jgi:hypothetical protein
LFVDKQMVRDASLYPNYARSAASVKLRERRVHVGRDFWVAYPTSVMVELFSGPLEFAQHTAVTFGPGDIMNSFVTIAAAVAGLKRIPFIRTHNLHA